MRIVVVKTGNKYTALQVERLYAQCRAWLQFDEFLCYTENPLGLTGEIRVENIPTRPSYQGWWGKLYQFAVPSEVPTLYLDIDVQIRGGFHLDLTDRIQAPLDPLAVYKPERGVEYINSSVMYWSGDKTEIFGHYIQYANHWQSKYRGDQEYLWGEHRNLLQYMPGITESFKWGTGRSAGYGTQPIVLYHGEDVKRYV